MSEFALPQHKDWMKEANCRGLDPDLFFPERGESIEPAVAVCRECLVGAECLKYAIDLGYNEPGIYAGTSLNERRRIMRRRRRVA